MNMMRAEPEDWPVKAASLVVHSNRSKPSRSSQAQGGHRMQLHSEEEDKRPNSIWVGGCALRGGEKGKVGMA